MKKLLVASLMFLSVKAGAVDNTTLSVILSLQSVSVTSNVDTVNIAAALTKSRVSDRAVFTNNGSVAEDFSIRLTSTTGSWTATSGTPGTDQYRLFALWHHFSTLTSTMTNEFQTDDILTASPQQSSDVTFFNDSETHETNNVKGYNVATGDQRNVFFRFDAPSSTATANSSAASVNVSATAIP